MNDKEYLDGIDINSQMIIDNSIETLNKALELGGSTVSSYHPEQGVDGRFQNELLAYGKVNQKERCCSSSLL